MSAIKPPASTPNAWKLRYAVKARLATDSEVPKALVSATTEKLLMPLPDRLISAKKPVRPMIVGVRIDVSPSLGPAAAEGAPDRAGGSGTAPVPTPPGIDSGARTSGAQKPVALRAAVSPAPAAGPVIRAGRAGLASHEA